MPRAGADGQAISAACAVMIDHIGVDTQAPGNRALGAENRQGIRCGADEAPNYLAPLTCQCDDQRAAAAALRCVSPSPFMPRCRSAGTGHRRQGGGVSPGSLRPAGDSKASS